MAMVAPFLPLIIAGASAGASIHAGREQQKAYSAQAYREGTAAREREIARRRRLVDALASQRANAGARGIGLSGSVGNMMRSDSRRFALDQLTASANTQAYQSQLRAQGVSARQAGYTKAASSLLTGYDRYQQRG